MDKYIEIVLEMYFKGCTLRQAIGIALDIKNLNYVYLDIEER